MPVRTYDPKQVVVSVGLVTIGGFADGTAIQVTRTNDAFTVVSGTDGVTSRSKSNDRSGEITFTLAQTSPSNDHLSGLALLDETLNTGIVPVTIEDTNGTSKYFSSHAWVKKQPDIEFAKELTNREWVLQAVDIDYFTGGNPDAE